MRVVSPAYPVRLLLAVIGYLALYVLGNNLAWLLRTPKPGRLGRAVELVRTWRSQLPLGEALRLVYYVVVPYLILYHGWASPLDLGLAGLDWIQGVGITVVLGATCLLLLTLIWWQYSRLGENPVALEQAQWLDQPWGWALVVRETILLESWWALCRSPMLLLAGPYFGVYLGLAAVFAVGLLNARTWHEMGTPGYREGIILTVSLAIATATLYVFVRNLWLCMALHLILRMAVLQVVRIRGTGRLSDS